MTGKRKGLIAFLSIALVAVMTAGFTFAYLTGNAGETTNVFTFSDNIRGQLDEPNWDPDQGSKVLPGMTLRKDPMITNTSDNGVSEYAAIMVTFQPGDGASYASGTVLTDEDTAKLLSLIDVDWNQDAWTLIGAYGDSNTWTAVADGNETTVKAMNNQVWVYKNAIAPGEVTTPLFNSITIHSDMADTDMAWLSGVTLDHDPDCWTYGTHDDASCTITYKHHESCAIYGQADAGSVPAGGEAANGATCDCTPAEQHASTCPSLTATLKPDCGHTVAGSIQGFKLVNAGAILQADQFKSATDAATVTAFSELFKK